MLTTSYHISVKMFPKSLISELSLAIASVYINRQGLSCYVILQNTTWYYSFGYKCLDQPTHKMSDSDENMDISKDIKTYTFEPLAKRGQKQYL